MVLGTANMFAFEVDGISYNITSESGLTVEVTRKEYRGNIVIPESVTYNNKKYRVTSIGKRAFASCLWLTSLTIPKSITSVQEYAFSELIRLESVTINCKTVKSWFSDNYSLKKVVLGNGVEIIDNYAFFSCGGISSLSIPNTVKSIGEYAFQQCGGLTSLTIPGSVKVIGQGAFAVCTSLKELKLSYGIERIGNYAFSNCRKLRRVIIPRSVTFIGLNAFESTDLTEIYLPSSLQESNRRGAFETSSFEYIHYYDDEKDIADNNPKAHTTGVVTELAKEVDTMPSFVGGTQAMVRFLKTNLKYPKVCEDYEIAGTVNICFVVEVDGSIRDAAIAKSVDIALDREALRLVKLMPKWNPAIKNGKPVAKKILLSIPFILK